jgi:hypothetical protein
MCLSASVVPGEVNTTNNNKQADNLVTLLYNGHDIAVITVGPSKTVVGQGYSMSITAIVKDCGVFSETFNTTVFANTTAIYVLTVGLQSGTSATLSFTRNTTGVAKGNYTISAYATPVPDETDTGNNQLSNGSVYVGIPADIDGDGDVDPIDLGTMGAAWDSFRGDANFNPNADINDDNNVGSLDLGIMGTHWGEILP